MALTLAQNGNAIDQKYASIANESFPNYESFWSKYVGCESGMGLESKSIEIPGIDPDIDRKRKLIGQWNYSILMDFVHLGEITLEIPEYSINNFTKLERLYMLAISVYYNALDCIDKICDLIDHDRLNNDNKESFREFRDIIVHDVRPLIHLDLPIGYCVLSPNGYLTLSQYSRGNFVWTDLSMEREYYIPLKEYIELLKGYLISDFNCVLDIATSAFKKLNMLTIPYKESEYLAHPSAAAVEGKDYWENREKPTPSASITNRSYPPTPPINKT